MQGSAASVVNAFLSGMGSSNESMRANYARYLAKDVEWHTGTELCRSLDESLACLDRAGRYDVSYWNADVLNEAENGAIVFNERVDHIYRPDGSKLGETYVCAIFEVAGDQIVKWRDYYDPTEFRQIIRGS